MSTKDRIIGVAEKSFFSRGYKSVSLQEICSELKIRPASLYYHFPGGKEELYLEVVKRRTTEFRMALEGIAFRHKTLREILRAFGHWYITQPPMNMILIAEMDLPFLSAKGRNQVERYVGNALFEPLGQLFVNCEKEIRQGIHPHLLVSTFNVLLFSIKAAAKMGGERPQELVEHIVSIFLDGISARGKK